MQYAPCGETEFVGKSAPRARGFITLVMQDPRFPLTDKGSFCPFSRAESSKSPSDTDEVVESLIEPRQKPVS